VAEGGDVGKNLVQAAARERKMTFNSLKISTCTCMPDDRWVLMYLGRIVAVVERNAPIEDAMCDHIIVPQADYDRIADNIARLGRSRFV
jgi:hypothetical protein